MAKVSPFPLYLPSKRMFTSPKVLRMWHNFSGRRSADFPYFGIIVAPSRTATYFQLTRCSVKASLERYCGYALSAELNSGHVEIG